MTSRCSVEVAGLAQSVERQALNLVVVGSSPTAGETLHFAEVGENELWLWKWENED